MNEDNEASQQRIYTFDCTSDGELWNRFAHNLTQTRRSFAYLTLEWRQLSYLKPCNNDLTWPLRFLLKSRNEKLVMQNKLRISFICCYKYLYIYIHMCVYILLSILFGLLVKYLMTLRASESGLGQDLNCLNAYTHGHGTNLRTLIQWHSCRWLCWHCKRPLLWKKHATVLVKFSMT